MIRRIFEAYTGRAADAARRGEGRGEVRREAAKARERTAESMYLILRQVNRKQAPLIGVAGGNERCRWGKGGKGGCLGISSRTSELRVMQTQSTCFPTIITGVTSEFRDGICNCFPIAVNRKPASFRVFLVGDMRGKILHERRR